MSSTRRSTASLQRKPCHTSSRTANNLGPLGDRPWQLQGTPSSPLDQGRFDSTVRIPRFWFGCPVRNADARANTESRLKLSATVPICGWAGNCTVQALWTDARCLHGSLPSIWFRLWAQAPPLSGKANSPPARCKARSTHSKATTRIWLRTPRHAAALQRTRLRSSAW